MPTLKEFIAHRPATISVRLAGQQLSARVLSTADLSLIEATYPQPLAPMRRKSLGAGKDFGAPAPDETDPEYQRLSAAWWTQHNVRCVAVGLSENSGCSVQWPTNPGDVAGAKAYLDEASAIVSQLPWPEVAAAAKLIRGAADPVEVAEGN